MHTNKNLQVFFELLRAGLWPNDNHNQNYNLYEGVDWGEAYRIASEQSVIGLVVAGLESLREKSEEYLTKNLKIPQGLLLQMIGEVQMIEQRNKAMNEFVAKLIENLRKDDIYAILVKGQGIAQCYERPLWRASGDVDLLLSEENYEKAKKVLLPLATDVESEYKVFKHLGMSINGFSVELHGTLHSRLSKLVDRVVDDAQNDVFFSGSVRSWKNGDTQVFLPSPDNDVIFVFTHILHHFYIEGVGLRQICDWCRLLWTYRDKLDLRLLESRLREAGLMSEWKAFYALAVNFLGMPDVGSGLMVHDSRFDGRADRIMEFVLESGNFGHNRETAKGKLHSLWLKTKDFARHALVFPWDSIKFYFHFLGDGLRIATDK